jgi:hypothetical protein
MRLIAAAAVAAAVMVANPAYACAFDGMPGYSHYAMDGADPYAGAYAEAAARIAEQRRQEAIETARLAMLKRLGVKDSADDSAAPVALAAANAQP